MKLNLKAFPVVYFTVRCKKHDCWVEVRPNASTDRSDQHVIGGHITALQCQTGGEARTSRCVDDWEMSISSSGSVTINP